MQNSIQQEFVGADFESQLLVKADGITLRFNLNQLGIHLLGHPDSFFHDSKSKMLIALRCQYPANVPQVGFIVLEHPGVGHQLTVAVEHEVSGLEVDVVQILICTVLLHNEDSRSCLQNLIEFACAQLVESLNLHAYS